MSTGRRIIQNFGFLTAGKFTGDAASFVLFVILARMFGQEGIGQYSFAMGLTGFLVVFADFGLNPFSVKELSSGTRSFKDTCDRILTVRLVVSAVVLVVLLFAFVLPMGTQTRLVIVLIGIYQVLITLLAGIGAVFVAREDTHLAGMLEASLKTTAAAAGIAAALVTRNLVVAVGILPLVCLGQVFIGYWILARKYGRPSLVRSVGSLVGLMQQAMPYALSRMLAQVCARVDVVLVGLYLGAAAAGVYNVAYRVVFLLMAVAHFAAMAVFPTASRAFSGPREHLAALYGRSVSLIVMIALPVAAGVALVAGDLMEVVYGQEFSDSAGILQILCILLLGTFLSRMMGIFLMSCDRQVARTKCLGIAAIVSLTANLVLIPSFGVWGAAIAVSASELLLVALFAASLRSVLGWPRLGAGPLAAAAGVGCFCLVFTLLPRMPLALVIPGSALLYGAVLLVCNQVRLDIPGIVAVAGREPR